MTDQKSAEYSDYYEGKFLEHYNVDYIKQICRELRKSQTKSENILWEVLRNRKLAGLKFLRQHPFGRCIVDFYCHDRRLVVEVDGGIHNNPHVKEYDRMRQELIERHGVKFFRCTSEDVENNVESVLLGIVEAAFGTHPPTPSLTKRVDAGGRGEL